MTAYKGKKTLDELGMTWFFEKVFTNGVQKAHLQSVHRDSVKFLMKMRSFYKHGLGTAGLYFTEAHRLNILIDRVIPILKKQGVIDYGKTNLEVPSKG